MDINNVCVIGGSGFVGRHIVHRLSAQRYFVRVPTRRRERANPLILLPTVDVVEADVHSEAELASLVRGMDAVINLAGVLHEGRGERSFEEVHVALTRKLIAACQSNGVRRYVHMSALGADVNGPSKYQRTKGAAESLVRASNLGWTIFRPSVIFGRDDSFLNVFAKLLKFLPAMVLARPRARFQPVFVEDVACAFVRSLPERAAFGQSYELGGPSSYTLCELVELIGGITGYRRPILGLSDTLSYLQAFALELLPVKLMTRDNYHSMKVENVTKQPFPFGIVPAAIEAIVPAYLGTDSPRARYRTYRSRAGRVAAR
jgi:uncharacterized protein YbjT (DUF2867 family)